MKDAASLSPFRPLPRPSHQPPALLLLNAPSPIKNHPTTTAQESLSELGKDVGAGLKSVGGFLKSGFKDLKAAAKDKMAK